MPPAKADWSSKWLTKSKPRRRHRRRQPRSAAEPTRPLRAERRGPWRRRVAARRRPRQSRRRQPWPARDERGGRGGDDGGEELIEKLVHINRVSKTVKGGKRFGFAALVVVGDGKGRRASARARRARCRKRSPRRPRRPRRPWSAFRCKEGRTLHHDGNGPFRRRPRDGPHRASGTGIIAGGPMRAVFESLGVADVVTKSVGTSNPTT
jgi:ribosomal protein S5